MYRHLTRNGQPLMLLLAQQDVAKGGALVFTMGGDKEATSRPQPGSGPPAFSYFFRKLNL